MRSSAISNIQNDDEYCFIWSILAYLPPVAHSRFGHPTKVSNNRQYFNELNIQGLNFTNGFKCSDVHKFEKLNNLSVNIFDFGFFQDQSEWKLKLIPIEVS